MTQAQELAANDSIFKSNRSRTVPIPETLCSIPGYPEKLRVYRIKASRYWQVRCWFKGKTYTRSLRTTSRRNALNLAKVFFDELSGKLHLGTCRRDERPRETPFSEIAAKMFAQESERQTRGEFSKGSLQVMRNRLDLHILPQLGALPIQAVGYVEVQMLADRLGRLGFSTTTISQYLVIVRKTFKLANRIGLLAAVPEFPRIKVSAIPRGGFSASEYRGLLCMARRLVGRIHPMARTLANRKCFRIGHELLKMPRDVADVIGFMVNTFVRPSDIKLMKHRHIEEVRRGSVYLRMNLPETKKHDKPVVSMRAAVRLYRRMQAKAVESGFGRPDDYVFLPQMENRERALAVLNLHFQWVMKEAGLTFGPLGQRRTLYSLRHTAISFRLLYGQGIDMLTLARNARTSVQMIERFYASGLSGEMNVALLQSRRHK